jgi:hypothetical protein
MADAAGGTDGPDPEDAKLVTLARATRARTGAARGAAVRDTTGRTYVGADVTLPSLRLGALQVAVAAAVIGGADGLEAAVLLGDWSAGEQPPTADIAAVRDVAPDVPVQLATVDGALLPRSPR